MKKMAILSLTPAVFRELMQLPDGVIVTNIETPIDKNGVVEVRIEGAGWDTYEGARIQYAPAATIEEGCDVDGIEITFINWNFPDDP